MAITVNVEDFNKGSEPGLRKLQLLVDAVTELQQEVTQVEAILGAGAGDGAIDVILVQDGILVRATLQGSINGPVDVDEDA